MFGWDTVTEQCSITAMGIMRSAKCERVFCETLCENWLRKVNKLLNADSATYQVTYQVRPHLIQDELGADEAKGPCGPGHCKRQGHSQCVLDSIHRRPVGRG